jgi:hypothetical protein
MSKNKVITFVLLTVILASGKAFCQQEIKGKQVNTISGKITYVDTAGGVINVQTDSMKMALYISVESDLLRYAHHIASIEIEKGDPVIIQYATTSSGKNVVIRLEDNRPDPLL